ncbi:NECAP-like protein CG9132 [Actinia tenebrosa]|uniref:NECAP-like protein CG9132 n=1 Tax=Actinia tenebrosa TaxID=6105 RepID=A0A6P8HA62_ACTTE|nr:NECAP-like protein CG9132 [Actinia tenebrosa]
MADAEYESVLCVKNEVFIYRIPPRTSSRGYRAADWKLENPDWTGRMRICSKGKECYIKIEDKVMGELFAKCNVDDYPGIAVEAVLDSSRYFVLKIEDADTGRHAFIGLGFSDRGDAFDFNVALQDHFKWVKKSEEIEAEKSFPQPDQPKLDLAFKQGQTIHINIGNKSSTSKPKAAGGASGILVPPPPPGITAKPPKLAPPPSSGGSASPLSSRKVQQTQPQPTVSSALFSEFSEFAPPTHSQQPASNVNEWGDFTSASTSQGSNNSGDWVQF